MTTRPFIALIEATLMTVAVPVTSAQDTAAPSGVFLIGPGGTPKQVPAVASQDEKTSGAGKSMLSGGLSKSSWTTRYSGATAKFVVTDRQPVFLFRFVDRSQLPKGQSPEAALAAARASGGGLLPGNDAKDYTLAKLTVEGDSRVASSKGLQAVKFTTEKKGPREFEVRVSAPLDPGEYAFFFAMVGAPAQIFAFTVR